MRLRPLALLLVLLLIFFSARAETGAVKRADLHLFDFDGTLVENRAALGGAFHSYIHLFAADGSERITISNQDLALLLSGNASLRLSYNKTVDLVNFRLKYPESYEHHREAPAGSGHNFLLEDFQASEARSPEGKWMGPAWSNFIHLCSTAESANTVGILTGRSHSIREWSEFFRYLQLRGYIQFRPAVRLVFNVSRAEFAHFGSVDRNGDVVDIATRKAGVLAWLVVAALKASEREMDLRTRLYFYDDEKVNLEHARAAFNPLEGRYGARIKFQVVDTSVDAVRKLGRAQCENLFLPASY